MREKVVKQYCHEIGKRLDCDRRAKKKLLNGFSAELRDRGLPESTSLTELHALVGSPEAVASEMRRSAEVKPVPYGKYAFHAFVIALAAALLLCIGTIAWVVRDTYLANRGQIIVYPPIVISREEFEDTTGIRNTPHQSIYDIYR